MDTMEDLLSFVRNIQLSDLLTISWIIIMIVFTIGISVLFDAFIEIKPAGRKTVMGKLYIKSDDIGKHS